MKPLKLNPIHFSDAYKQRIAEMKKAEHTETIWLKNKILILHKIGKDVEWIEEVEHD